MPRRKQQQSVDIKRWEHMGYFLRIKDNKQSGFIGNISPLFANQSAKVTAVALRKKIRYRTVLYRTIGSSVNI